MNSGMKITNRRNHSLVVFHYNDPVNGNPGTDATVYDPAPDFKFLNDSNNYVLIQTYMDKVKKDLIFTLWGAKDGRQASYSHPIVSKWYSSGEPKDIETDKLEPGKKNAKTLLSALTRRLSIPVLCQMAKKRRPPIPAIIGHCLKFVLLALKNPEKAGAFVVPPVTEEIVGLVEG